MPRKKRRPGKIKPFPGPGRAAGDFEFEVSMEDLYEMEKGYDWLWQKWPRLMFVTFGKAIQDSVQQAMEDAAPVDTGAMKESVETEYVIDDKYRARALGDYTAEHAKFYIEGTNASIGRFVPGLVPNDTINWNAAGARLTLASALARGRSPDSIGMHPGTEAHWEIYNDIETRLNMMLDHEVEKFGEQVTGAFEALLTGGRF